VTPEDLIPERSVWPPRFHHGRPLLRIDRARKYHQRHESRKTSRAGQRHVIGPGPSRVLSGNRQHHDADEPGRVMIECCIKILSGGSYDAMPGVKPEA
jgi:hypothetical protein